MKSILLYTEPGKCQPSGYYRSNKKAAHGLGIHANTVANQFKKQGFYTGPSGTLIKINEL
jgi:hypothetical protein